MNDSDTEFHRKRLLETAVRKETDRLFRWANLQLVLWGGGTIRTLPEGVFEFSNQCGEVVSTFRAWAKESP